MGSVSTVVFRAWLGIPIFGSDFLEPHCKQNSNSIFDSKDSGWIFFEIPMSGESENWKSAKFGILVFFLHSLY